MTDVHACSPYCDRPECIKRQRDNMRDHVSTIMLGDDSAALVFRPPTDDEKSVIVEVFVPADKDGDDTPITMPTLIAGTIARCIARPGWVDGLLKETLNE